MTEERSVTAEDVHEAAHPPELDQAAEIHGLIRATVMQQGAEIRALMEREFDDAEWDKRGVPLTTLFFGLEIGLEMLRDSPSTVLTHFIGISNVHLHLMLAHTLGIKPGSEKHLTLATLVSAALEGNCHVGSKSVH